MSRPELLIQLIDEVQRTKARLGTVAVDFNDPGGPTGLTMTILTAVTRALHPPTVPQIGRSLGYPRQTVQRHADQLVELGLIEAVENPDHKRAPRLMATEAGQALHARANARSLAWARTFTADIDPEKLATTVATLQTIRAKIERQARETPDETTDETR